MALRGGSREAASERSRSGQEDRAGHKTSLLGARLAGRASHVRSRLLFMLLDAVAVVVAYSAAEVFYFRDKPPALYWRHLAIFLALALVLHLVSNRLFGLYDRIWRHAGIEEARQVILSVLVVLAGLLLLRPLWQMLRLERVPVPVILIGALFVTMAMGALRFHSRLFAWQRGSRRTGLRVAVIGSRDAGAAALREMIRSPGAGLVPVAVFDDEPHGHGRSLMGVPVVGPVEDIPAAAERFMIQQVLLAIPNPSPHLVDRALAASEAAGVTLKVLPSVRDLVAERPRNITIRQARDPRIEDLLGRTTVSTDLQAVERSLADQRVLITGAGGSIGSEIARQVATFKPAKVILLDHDETHLYDAANSLSVEGVQVLADVTDPGAVFDAFLRHRPDVVFHAAAHKHVPMLEAHPVEAAKVNVFGTLNALHAAKVVGTGRFVMISTDKAVRPASVMGASKRLGEMLVMTQCPPEASYCSVRFGNVLGSRGSVIPTFARQIAEGGPVTVTDPRMTRYFMSVEEAVQLVLQASVLSRGGETFVLEMGEAVRILDLAERMIRLSGFEVGSEMPIRIIGRRPGEKLHEVLREADEDLSPTAHPSVKRLVARSTPPQEVLDGLPALAAATERRDGALIREILFSLSDTTPLVPLSDFEAQHKGNGSGNGSGNGHANGNGHRSSATAGDNSSAPVGVPADQTGPLDLSV